MKGLKCSERDLVYMQTPARFSKKKDVTELITPLSLLCFNRSIKVWQSLKRCETCQHHIFFCIREGGNGKNDEFSTSGIAS